MGFKNFAVEGVYIGIDFRETFEILVLEKNSTSLVHFVNVQRHLIQIASVVFKGILSGMNVVFVSSFSRVKPGVSFIGNLKNIKNHYVFG